MIKKLLSIYPVIEEGHDSKTSPIRIPYEGSSYLIDTSQMSQTEIDLIEAILESTQTKSMWHQFFINKTDVVFDNLEGVGVLQFHLKQDFDHNALWLETLTNFFDNVIDAFFINNTQGVIIVSKRIESGHILEAQFESLNDDFSVQASIYIGGYYETASLFMRAVPEETLLFEALKKKWGVHTFESSYLDYWVANALQSSTIAQILLQKIASVPDDVQLIISLWDAQGNLSVTAQALYIHRNTLNYRLDRFYQRTQINLRNNNNLLLCYLITTLI